MRYFVLEQSKFAELYNIKKTDAQFSSDSRSQIPSESETVGAETGTEDGMSRENGEHSRSRQQPLETFEKTNKL